MFLPAQERPVVFVGAVGDSTHIVPWLFTARTKPGGVDRTARAWLKRGDVWDDYFDVRQSITRKMLTAVNAE